LQFQLGNAAFFGEFRGFGFLQIFLELPVKRGYVFFSSSSLVSKKWMLHVGWSDLRNEEMELRVAALGKVPLRVHSLLCE